jgi:hypothetical protein
MRRIKGRGLEGLDWRAGIVCLLETRDDIGVYFWGGDL